jgi:oligopeptide/dipeptide ABC transporter ATP-binding protein
VEHIGLLDVHHLTVGYPDGGRVLQDVSLHIHEGEIVCVIGESGCGKSTLLNAILQMPGRLHITEGEILFRGRNLRTLPREEVRRLRGTGMGMVFQEPGASMDPIRKIGAQFYETMRAHAPISRREAMGQAEDLLARLDLQDTRRILGSYPVELSGGQKQRVAIALAMALRPDILLADEPTSALDVTVQAQIVEELMRLRDDFGTALLVVTHNMGVVSRMADKVAVMYGGRIVEYGYRHDVMTAPAHPYTRALMDAIPRPDGTPPKAIPGVRTKKEFDYPCPFLDRCPYAHPACRTEKAEKIPIHGEHWTLCNAGIKGGAAS